MKKLPFLIQLLFIFAPAAFLYSEPVSVPDTRLEAALEAKIGDNGVSGTVDGDWLVGQDGDAGVYRGEPGGLSTLGMDGEALFTVTGVSNLTGLEHARNLSALLLQESPIASLLPLVHLEKLSTLALDACGITDAQLEQLFQAGFSLATIALVNSPDDPAHHNHVTAEKVYALIARHPAWQRLYLGNLGMDISLKQIAGIPRLADPPCGRELHLSGNSLASLDGISSFYDVTLLDLSSCGITDAILATADWSLFACLEAELNLRNNKITDAAPLLNLPKAKHGLQGQQVLIDLDENRLNNQSIHEHVPALESKGYKVTYLMELFIECEGQGDVPPRSGRFWHPYGESVLCIAQPRPDTGQGFVGWKGDITTDDYAVAFDMTGHRRLTAIFSETPAPGRAFYALHVSAEGDGKGSVLPAYGTILYRDGETAGLLAMPEPGNYFGGWRIQYEDMHAQENATAFCSEPSHTVIMNRSVAATAHFTTKGFTLTVDYEGDGGLSFPPGSYSLAQQTNLVVRTLPKPGWRLKHWTDGEGNIRYAPKFGDDPDLHISLDADTVVHAVFEKAVRTLKVNLDLHGASGQVLLNEEAGKQQEQYAYGETVTLTAVPYGKDNAFAGWSGNLPGEILQQTEFVHTIAVVMDENREITATFAPAETYLEIGATLNGTSVENFYRDMMPKPGVYGFIRHPENLARLAVALAPDMPAAFAGWQGDLDGKHWSSDFVEFVPMDQDRKITAIFQTQNTCKVALTYHGNGSISPVPGNYTVVSGRVLNISAQPDENNCFGGWRIKQENGEEQVLLLPELPLMISGNVEATAYFGAPRYSLWVDVSNEAVITTPPAGLYTLPEHTVVDLNAVAPQGSMFHYWMDHNGAVVSETPACRVALTSDTGYTAVVGDPGYRVHADAAGTGSGTVTVAPADVVVFPPSSLVELQALPEPNSVFVRWEGVPIYTGLTNPTLSFTLAQDVNATAIFQAAECYLTIQVTGIPDGLHAQIVPEPGKHGYLKGMEATLFAAPPPGSEIAFAGWEYNGIMHINPELICPMETDIEVTAHFVPKDSIESVLLNILPVTGDGNGVLKPLCTGEYYFTQGAAIKVSCNLQGETFFAGYTGDFSGEFNYHGLTVLLNENTSIGAAVSSKGLILTLGLSGQEGGIIYPSPGSYRLAHGLEILLRATRTNIRWTFDGWFDDRGKILSSYGRFRFTTPENADAATIIGMFHRSIETTPIEYCMAPHPPVYIKQ